MGYCCFPSFLPCSSEEEKRTILCTPEAVGEHDFRETGIKGFFVSREYVHDPDDWEFHNEYAETLCEKYNGRFYRLEDMMFLAGRDEVSERLNTIRTHFENVRKQNERDLERRMKFR